MRRNLQRLMVVMAAMMICLGASAIDKVVKKATLTGEVTSMEDLKASTFLLANGEGAGTVVLYIPDGWDFKVGKPSVLSGSTGQGAYYKLEALGDNYQVPVFNIDKNARTGWWGSAYLNSQPKGGSVIFGLSGTNDQKGQDGPNLAVWTITYEEAKGFAFKCVGRDDADIYVGHDGTAARPVTEITYWKAYTGFESAYDAAEVEAAAKGVEAALKTSDAKTAYDDAKAAYEADKDLDKYVAAINAAVDVINLCEKVNKQYADYKLSTLGAAAVKGVVDKYNAGEYKDAAALSAAYVEAVKAQNCDGADMTGAIYNPSFELGNIDGWTSENCGNVANNYNFGGRTGDKFCERWQGSGGLSNGKFYQALTGLPNGTYKVTADLQNREQGNGDAAGTGFFVFANDDRTEGLDANNGKTIEVTTEVADGNLTLGVQLDGCSGNWICFDNFTLTLVKAANAVVPEKDAWYTGADFFRFRADKNASAESPYIAYKDKVEPAWGAAAGEETNGCIVCKVPANVNPASQIWIRGTEAGKTVANGSKDGFKITFRVKADGEYTLESQAHNNWGYKTGGNPFGPLNVTTEWQTVTFVCTGEKAKNDFTDLCFNLSGDAERTIYFDDVQISRGSEWYLNNEFHAKDYQDPSASYSDGQNPHPVARYVADAEGGYVEVISNAGAANTYNSQLWIAIPEQFVGTISKMTMEVQATKEITCPESFQATATGNGWGCNPGPGKGVEFKVGEWTTIERILKTNGVQSTGTWKNLQADQYCLDLSDVSDAKEAVTYKFRNVKFEEAQEDWYTATPIFAKDYTKGTETYTNGNPIPKAPYVYGNGAEGGYIQVVSNASAANDYDSQIFFEIPEELRGKSLQISMKAKASKEISVAAQLHSTADGNGWGPAPAGDAVAFTVGEWTEIKRTFNSDATDQNGKQVAYYVLNLSEKNGDAITYNIDEVSFQEFIDWGELEEAPVEGTLVATQDWTTATSYSGWSILNDATKLTVSKGEGLVIENSAELDTPYSSQFFVADGWTFDAGKQYVVRYTAKIKGEGSIRTDVNHWGDGVADDGVPYTDGYKQILFTYGVSPVSTGGWHVIFQPGKFIGKIILEKVELFDVTPKYDEMDWSDNIVPNGDLATDDMSAFILKNNDVENPEMLLAKKDQFGEIGIETTARPTNEDGSVGGNDHDAQFFVRLPYVLPKGTLFNFEFDLYAEEVNTIAIQAHDEPGQYKANLSSVKTDPAVDAVHFQKYLSAPADMRTIAFNLAVATDATYGFSNIKVQIVNDDKAAIEEATQTADATTLWAETLALNEACYAGRIAETEGCTEESVKALTDAIAAGKAELANAEATKETLAAAAKAIEDAIEGLTTGAAEELLPKPELGADFIEIAQDQGKSLDDFTRTDLVEGEDYNTYTAHGDLNIALKMMPVDVEGCDYVVVYFATPAPEGWKLAFWNNQDLVDVPAGATEFKYVFAEDPKCDVKDGVLPQICMMTFFGAPNPLEAKIYGIYKHKVPAELAYTDLTPEMFFQWSATDETAVAVSTSPCDYNIATSTGQPYGLSTVNEDRFADLSAYSTIELTATEGEPRLLFNRLVAEGTVYAEVPRDKDKYETVVDNGDGSKTYIVDIAAIVAEYGFAHLHAIKGANWKNTTVNSIKLGYVGDAPEIPVPTNINGVEDGASVKDGKYFINGQIVIVKNGVKYNAAGQVIE